MAFFVVFRKHTALFLIYIYIEKAMSDLKPEEQARVLIDEMLAEAGWAVVPRSEYSEIQSAQAVTEALTKGICEADYLLFLGGKAIGVLEAKSNAIFVYSEPRKPLYNAQMSGVFCF